MSRVIDADAFKKQVAAIAIKENYPIDKVAALLQLIDTQPSIINGIVTEAQYTYQRMTCVRPVEHHYEEAGETPYIKYGCPVCESLGNIHQLTPNETNCPLCGVKLCWDTNVIDNMDNMTDELEIVMDDEAINEFVRKEEVLGLIEGIKCDDSIPKNYGTLLDIMRLIRGMEPMTMNVKEDGSIKDVIDQLVTVVQDTYKKDVEKTIWFVIDRLTTFRQEYEQYSESSVDYFGGKAESMQVALTIVQNAFNHIKEK